MPTLTAGQITTETIGRGRRLVVTVATGSAIVERSHNGRPLDTTPIAAGTSTTYGEYLTDIALRISCVAGSVTFVESQSTDAVNVGFNANTRQLTANGRLANLAGGPTLPRWASALATMRAGGRNARLMIVSDSTGVGAYANGTAYGGNNYASCWPYLLKPYFEAQGLLVNTDSVFGDCTNGGTPATLMANDTRRVLGANWVTNISLQTSGGNVLFHNTNGAIDPTSIITTKPTDTVTVGVLGAASGYGKIAIDVDGVQQGAAIDLNGSDAMVFATRTFALGTHTISARRAATTGANGPIALQSIRCSDSTKPSVDIWNVSAGGVTSAMEADTSAFYTPLLVNNLMAPDLVAICLDINDWTSSVTPGTYDLATTTTHAYNLLKIINAYKATADVILLTGAPSSTGSYAQATVQEPTLQATRQVARIVNCPLVDISQIWGGYAQATANGFYAPAGDVLHPGAFGQADIARNFAAVPYLFGA